MPGNRQTGQPCPDDMDAAAHGKTTPESPWRSFSPRPIRIAGPNCQPAASIRRK